ncbi:hypothetical protein [Rhizobium sp. TRM95796]|uniref:hypothetical protein n=1 Tax=Rhizobium sp. TRM95796 TaxID=2979862 RepID=UPI0021E91E71|nr:hypothetical protein [Rhizobium sp. TRM95796]MCV3767709.1 hypothetical protein [Rhizobium sp. TRM95796]
MTIFRPRKDIRNIAMMLRLFCALAIAMVGFAHKPLLAAEGSGYEVSVLPDGEIATMCLSSPDLDGKKSVGTGSCEACRLSSACLSPDPPESQGVLIRTALTAPFVARRACPPLDVLSYRGAPRASPSI